MDAFDADVLIYAAIAGHVVEVEDAMPADVVRTILDALPET